MFHLVVYAHPRSSSFNAQLRDAYCQELQNQGHEVVVRDLYEMEFNPILTEQELRAFRTEEAELPNDVLIEQDLIRRADVVTFIHPIWWISMPAILKGYIDRVFTVGFAYGYDPDGTAGTLDGKKGVLITTAGSTVDEFIETKKLDAIKIAEGLGTIEFCGMELVEHLHCGPVGSRSTKELLEGYLDQARDIVRKKF